MTTLTGHFNEDSEPITLWALQMRERFLRSYDAKNGNAYYSRFSGARVVAVAACVKALEARPFGLQLVDLNGGKNAFGLFGAGDTEPVYVSLGEHGFDIEAIDPKIGAQLYSMLYALTTEPDTDKRSVYYLLKQGNALQLHYTVIDWQDVDPKNYPGLDLDALDTLCTAKEPTDGRLAILHGLPGVGKTHLIRGLIARHGHVACFVVVSSELAAAATGPELLTVLMANKGEKPYVLIVEDADALLKKRATGDRAGFAGLSALLNASDGIVGALCDIRIIATMNTTEKDVDIDAAALRAGRCAVNAFLGEFESHAAVLRVAELAGKYVDELERRYGITAKSVGRLTLAAIYSLVRTLPK